MYTYKMELSLATSHRNFSLSEKRDVIERAIDRYNERPMQNPKTLKLQSVEEDHILVTLISALRLNSPGRGLKTLAAILIKEIQDADFISAIASNGQLFSAKSLEEQETNEEVDMVDYAQIKDVDVVKALMDFVCSKCDASSAVYQKKKAAFDQMKRIAFDAGMIKK